MAEKGLISLCGTPIHTYPPTQVWRLCCGLRRPRRAFPLLWWRRRCQQFRGGRSVPPRTLAVRPHLPAGSQAGGSTFLPGANS